MIKVNLKKEFTSGKNVGRLISSDINLDYFKKFKSNPYNYAHPISMLLTLNTFKDYHYNQ